MNVKLNDILEGIVVDFTYEGKGVIKIDNFVIFVLGGVIGDKIRFKITKVKKSFAEGKLIEILKSSKDRVKNELKIEESIGAIPLIKYDYNKGLEWKKKKVQNDLEKIGGLKEVNIKDTIGMENPYRYRNNVQIPIGKKDSKTVMGFYELGSNHIVDMKESILISEKANMVLSSIRKWINQYKIESFNETNKKGILRHLGIRINKNKEIMVILVTNQSEIPYINELINILKEINVISLYQNINNRKDSTTFGNKYEFLYGEDYLIDIIGDYKFKISPKSFLQVNRVQTEVLYNKVMEFLNPQKEDIVVDLYSGIGTISIFMAKGVKKVVAIESVKAAVDDAKDNASLNDIRNIDFLEGKAEIVFPKLLDEELKINKVVLDPPRKGCEKEVLEAIIKVQPERIIYVSCNSSTLARDVRVLVENGYKVVEVQPVDMFPHTPHVESIILMTYCGSKENNRV